jgi:hypothetical protein
MHEQRHEPEYAPEPPVDFAAEWTAAEISGRERYDAPVAVVTVSGIANLEGFSALVRGMASSLTSSTTANGRCAVRVPVAVMDLYFGTRGAAATSDCTEVVRNDR